MQRQHFAIGWYHERLLFSVWRARYDAFRVLGAPRFRMVTRYRSRSWCWVMPCWAAAACLVQVQPRWIRAICIDD